MVSSNLNENKLKGPRMSDENTNPCKMVINKINI